MKTLRPPLCLPFLLLLGAASCGPTAEPASGPVGEQVQQAIASGTESFDHSTFDDLLAEGTVDGLADYSVFSENRERLEAYLGSLAGANLATLEADHLKALLINAYNAYTIESILDHPEISSIRDIDGVWDERTHAVGGFQLTLDAIEHNLLRPYYQDPRIHFAVNCASMSCAPLPPWAFDGDRVDQQLARWTRETLADPKYLRVEDGRIVVSKLLDWYGDDFTDPEASPRADSLAGFLAEWGPPEVAELVAADDGSPPVRFMDYDWSLNRPSNAGGSNTGNGEESESP